MESSAARQQGSSALDSEGREGDRTGHDANLRRVHLLRLQHTGAAHQHSGTVRPVCASPGEGFESSGDLQLLHQLRHLLHLRSEVQEDVPAHVLRVQQDEESKLHQHLAGDSHGDCEKRRLPQGQVFNPQRCVTIQQFIDPF
ncbi:hypothetical protein CEXT_272761 [Caerostris extrusa]|uniref:Uncharacterized protein n=1 Tax=Caerostris extrusa TaxID=172846 RepID=A0AAV4MA42_CAEEX|nr:hypothetical protein CEXT_272761 [Caerostris extrusa]